MLRNSSGDRTASVETLILELALFLVGVLISYANPLETSDDGHQFQILLG